MRQSSLVSFASLGLGLAQLFDLDAIDKYPDPVLVSAPLDVSKDSPPDEPAPSATPITSASSRRRRSLNLRKRDGDCSPQPTGAGPVPSPDTADAFLAFPTLQVSH